MKGDISMNMKMFYVVLFSIMLGISACSNNPPAAPVQETVSHEHGHDHEDEDDHHHEAPHGGVLVELGDHVGNIEFLLEEDGTLTAYVFDAHAENAVRIEQPTLELLITVGDSTEAVSLDAVANALTGESVGDTSEFVARVQSLAGKANFEAELKNITFKGVDFANILVSYSTEKG